jgi:hypothetical protein
MPIFPVDEHGHSPFRAAVETKNFDLVIATLAPDVHFRSPAVFKPYDGAETVGMLLRAVAVVLGPTLSYQWQVQEEDREVLCFKATVGGRELEGVDLLRYDDQGRVAELVVMMRPASGLMAMRDEMGKLLAAHESGR